MDSRREGLSASVVGTASWEITCARSCRGVLGVLRRSLTVLPGHKSGGHGRIGAALTGTPNADRRVWGPKIILHDFPLHTSGSSGFRVLHLPLPQSQKKRRGGSGEKRRSVSSCPTPVLNRTCRFHPQARSPGGPACPESFLKSRAQKEGKSKREKVKRKRRSYSCLLTCFLRTACGGVGRLIRVSCFRLGAALRGFPPPQGLPEIFRGNEADGSEATVSHGEEQALRLSPEPPLLLDYDGLPAPSTRKPDEPDFLLFLQSIELLHGRDVDDAVGGDGGAGDIAVELERAQDLLLAAGG